MTNIPSSERTHIGFFGTRNAGKSSLVNAVTNQNLSVVSEVKGTTTDPVNKAMELLPLGPVVIIDTPGLDDEGTLGEMRVERAKRVLAKTDIAVLVVDATVGLGQLDRELIEILDERKIPYIIAHNKSDLLETVPCDGMYVSAKSGLGIEKLKNELAKLMPQKEKFIVADLIDKDDTVVLVTPIDEAAPKGRLILPQQLTLREVLDCNATAIVCQDTELERTLASLKSAPRLVITDSQVFGSVRKIVPESVPLTSFSILMARYKGELESLISGAALLKTLKDGDKVLISEGCTHHRQCNDIGTVKMPRWIEDFSKAKPDFRFTSGGEFPNSVKQYKLVVHCGGCILNDKEMAHRTETCKRDGVPIVNYGIAIANMNGILKRSLEIFPDLAEKV